MEMFFFKWQHKLQIKNLMARTGLTKDKAVEFLYEYYNGKTTFKEAFKGYLVEWLPDGENADGQLNCVYKYKFPKRTMNLNLLGGKKDISWFSLMN
jgi:hypothetical protein